MANSNYIKYIIAFQKGFKPIKHYSEQNDIVRKAIEVLAKVFRTYEQDPFIQGIQLVYPNYFTEGYGGRFVPIMDELICFNPNTPRLEELKSRVLQHMSYYMTGEDTQFIRISKSLLEHPQLSVDNFFVEKIPSADTDYRVYVNKLSKDYSCTMSPAKMMDDDGGERLVFDTELVHEDIGIFENLKDDDGEDVYKGIELEEYNRYIQCFSSSDRQAAQEGRIPDYATVAYNDASSFCRIFEVPLSAHFVMLADASLLYVYSQTAQIGNNDSSLGYGGMFVLIDRNMKLSRVRDYIRFFRLVSDNISTCIAHNIMREKQIKESIKSAISAIMSRNMSHNLGSHYLYYTKVQLDSLAKMMGNHFSPDIRGAAKVLGYIQARMDYLATVISNDQYPYGPVNFKSQLLDELTIDDLSKRHFPKGIDDITGKEKSYNRTVNHLLANLIRSESFTRPGIFDEELESSQLGLLLLKVRLSDDSGHYKDFTGTDFELKAYQNPAEFKDCPTMKSEKGIKDTLSYLDLAMPGGNMSCHAFFNIVENFIRNSAKYLRDDFEKRSNGTKVLETSIALRYSPDHQFMRIILYDNKKNAAYFRVKERTFLLEKEIVESGICIPGMDAGDLYGICSKERDLAMIRANAERIVKELERISPAEERLLKSARNIQKEWSDACLFEDIEMRLGGLRILNDNSVLENTNKGLKEVLFSSAWLRAYSFPRNESFTDIVYDIQREKKTEKKLQRIRDFGFAPLAVIEEGDTLHLIENISQLKDYYMEPACFGISFELPVFKKVLEIKVVPDTEQMLKNCRNVFADIVIADDTVSSPIDLRKTFTRFCSVSDSKGKNEKELFHALLLERFPDFDQYWLSFGGKSEPRKDDGHMIHFKHHLKDQMKGDLKELIGKYAYSDSVSGGNFTKTLNELFDSSIDEDGTYHNAEGEYLALKIKESALTRITIIDERLYDTMIQSGSEDELTLKNVRLLNYQETDTIQQITDLFVGNGFADKQNDSDFLSIHLGLVEKIINSTEFKDFCGEIISDADDRVRYFMKCLKESYGGDRLFISIHSGRGNFSAELEGPLNEYPFITMSAIEGAFNNCKYLLSQVFYNTAYIGKGFINSTK